MGNPQPGWPDTDTTAAKQGQRDDEFNSELLYMPHDQKSSDDPTSYQVTLGSQRNIARLLGPAAQGLCIKKDDDGRNVGVFGIGKYMIGATAYTLPGTYPILLDASSTTYLWCDEDETVETSTDDWPEGDHFKIAIVTTSADAVTNIIDCRMMNYGIGAITNWSGIAAVEHVDFNNKRIDDANNLLFVAATKLTIAGGVITPTGVLHTVEPESGAADEVDTITADAGQVGRFLLLRRDDTGDVITLTNNDNIWLHGDQCILSGAGDAAAILLMQYDADNWMEVSRNQPIIAALLNDVAGGGYSITNVGQLNLSVPMVAIDSGSFDVDYADTGQDVTEFAVETESMAATDDLDSVTGGALGDLLIVHPYNAARTVVVKHGIGADKFKLANGLDFEMNTLEHTLICRHNGTQWIEMARSPMRMESLVYDGQNDAGDYISRSVPYALGPIYLSGALSAKVYEQNIYVPVNMTIKNATGIVDGAPSGGVCTIDVRVNDASIFANDGERIQIADGNTQDTSATKNYAVTAGDIITIEVLSGSGSPNGADDAVIVLNCFCAPQTAPQA